MKALTGLLKRIWLFEIRASPSPITALKVQLPLRRSLYSMQFDEICRLQEDLHNSKAQ